MNVQSIAWSSWTAVLMYPTYCAKCTSLSCILRTVPVLLNALPCHASFLTVFYIPCCCLWNNLWFVLYTHHCAFRKTLRAAFIMFNFVNTTTSIYIGELDFSLSPVVIKLCATSVCTSLDLLLCHTHIQCTRFRTPAWQLLDVCCCATRWIAFRVCCAAGHVCLSMTVHTYTQSPSMFAKALT